MTWISFNNNHSNGIHGAHQRHLDEGFDEHHWYEIDQEEYPNPRQTSENERYGYDGRSGRRLQHEPREEKARDHQTRPSRRLIVQVVQVDVVVEVDSAVRSQGEEGVVDQHAVDEVVVW